MTNCFNCINFQWKEISDDPTIRASAGVVSCLHCKAMTYCSESCRLVCVTISYPLINHYSYIVTPRSEHWLKLHQFHCDIMRGAKVIPGGKHDKDSCLACKEESEAAGANNNGLPSLPCYLPNNFVFQSRVSAASIWNMRLFGASAIFDLSATRPSRRRSVFRQPA